MATAPTHGPISQAKASHEIGAYEQLIEVQIRRTRNQVKWVEVCVGLVTLAAGSLAFLLAVVLVDHWIMPLGTAGRWLCLLAFLGGAGAYIGMYLAPLVMRRINPIYAAHSIEQHAPTLKNSLVNFLLLRGGRTGVSKSVLQAVEHQAASGLTGAAAESAVDRSKLIKLGYVLLGVVLVLALYKFISPKDPLETFGRIAAPWANIAAPTRAKIESVMPGDTSVFTGQSVTIEASVRGLDDDEPVTLYYSTDDQRIEDQPIVMKKSPDGARYQCVLPQGSEGLQESVNYYVTALDAQSPTYRITVMIPPAISVKSVSYQYPAYTQRKPRETEGQGDITALEGTQVTVRAEANQPIADAYIDFNCDGVKDRRMKVDTKQATVTFPLRYIAKPGQRGMAPEFESYQIRFSNLQRHENPQPIRHSIEIIADLPPQAQIVDPTEKEVELPLNGSLEIKVRASDADYALSQVQLHGELASASGDLLIRKRLLNEVKSGEFTGSYRFVPQRFVERGLKVGDTVRYWAVARDNKHVNDALAPNVTQTEKFRIKITEPLEQDPNQPPPEKNRDDRQQKGDQPGDPMNRPQQGGEGQKEPADKQQGQGEKKQNSGDGQGQTDEAAGGQQQQERQDEKVNPKTDPGKAFEKINKRRQEQDKQQQDKKQQQQGEQPQEKKGQPEGSKQKEGDKPDQSGDKPDDGSQKKQGEQEQQKGQGEKNQSNDNSAKPKPMDGAEGQDAKNKPMQQAPQQGGSDSPQQGDKKQGGEQNGAALKAPRARMRKTSQCKAARTRRSQAIRTAAAVSKRAPALEAPRAKAAATKKIPRVLRAATKSPTTKASAAPTRRPRTATAHKTNPTVRRSKGATPRAMAAKPRAPEKRTPISPNPATTPIRKAESLTPSRAAAAEVRKRRTTTAVLLRRKPRSNSGRRSSPATIPKARKTKTPPRALRTARRNPTPKAAKTVTARAAAKRVAGSRPTTKAQAARVRTPRRTTAARRPTAPARAKTHPARLATKARRRKKPDVPARSKGLAPGSAKAANSPGAPRTPPSRRTPPTKNRNPAGRINRSPREPVPKANRPKPTREASRAIAMRNAPTSKGAANPMAAASRRTRRPDKPTRRQPSPAPTTQTWITPSRLPT